MMKITIFDSLHCQLLPTAAFQCVKSAVAAETIIYPDGRSPKNFHQPNIVRLESSKPEYFREVLGYATIHSVMSMAIRRSGQAMVEYILVFVALFAAIAAMAFFLRAARQDSERTATLVGSEYP